MAIGELAMQFSLQTVLFPLCYAMSSSLACACSQVFYLGCENVKHSIFVTSILHTHM